MDRNQNDRNERNERNDRVRQVETRTNRNEWDDLSNKLGNGMADMEVEDSFLNDVNASLAMQISKEMEEHLTGTNEKKHKKKKYKGLKIFGIVFSIFMVLSALLLFTSGGRRIVINIAGKYIYDKLDYDQTPNDNTDKNVDKGPTEVVIVDDVVNVLLLGVEEIGGASNTDSIMIATMNTKDKTMKLTSIMRDLYVDIPGYSKNRINSAYAKGDIDLLYQTIKLNLGINLDGYVSVNFESFEKIVDLIGGIEITLTKGEANYLNTTNYISNPAYRNVVAGTQIMNGNQALGYSRVRKVSTGSENNDYGRTQRHRIVMNAIFEKVKTKNVIQLGLLMNNILTNVNIKTDITNKQFNRYLEEAVSLKVSSLETYRIPSDGTFDNIKVKMGKYNQDVLQPKDWSLTRKEIREFIYGAEDSTTTVIK